MTEHEWDRMKKEIGEAYNPPPEIPRDAMWDAIEGRLGAEAPLARPSGYSSRQWGAVAAIAAGLVLWVGFGLGRATQGSTPTVASAPTQPAAGQPAAGQPAAGQSTAGQPAAGQPSAGQPSGLVRVAATRHLAATQTLLMAVDAEADGGTLNPSVAALATQLLTATRLMLDASTSDQDEMRALLEDLELVLVQVVHASKAGAGGDQDVGRMELQQLTQGMQDNDVLPRIQQLLPPVMAGAADE